MSLKAPSVTCRRNGGEYGDPVRVTAIARDIEFLRQADHLAMEYPELTS